MNKSKKFLWLIVTLLAVVALMPTRVAALEYHHARLLVDEDALVNQSQSTKNYGSSVDLLVGDVVAGWHDIGLCRSYLKRRIAAYAARDVSGPSAKDHRILLRSD